MSKSEVNIINSKKEICKIIDDNCLFKDSAWLIREMVGLRFLKKDGSKYWKSENQLL